jgi:hypothetical protein
MLRNWMVIARVTSIKSGVVIGREISGLAAVLWNINIFGSIYVAR